VSITWESSSSSSYTLRRSEDLVEFEELSDGIAGEEGSTTFVDTMPAGTKVLYYQVIEEA
jgi:hypothetical protein